MQSRRRFLRIGTSFAAAVTAIACKALPKKASGLQSAVKDDESYDFIIVGSGAGGGPLAVNLSTSGFKVLLMEAGEDQGNRGVYKIPAFHTISSEDPEMSWDYFVKHFDSDQKDQEDSKYNQSNRGILYPRAGTLGGCTSHNAMITVYPCASDWDQMGKDVGDQTYNGETMRRYFSLVENATYKRQPSRNFGWLPVRYASSFLVIGDNVIKSMVFAASRSLKSGALRGVKGVIDLAKLVTISDTNDPSPARDVTEGLALVPLAVNDKYQRHCVRDLIVEKKNKNLTIKTNCFVTRLLFSDDTAHPTVTGVEYVESGKVYEATKSPDAEGQKTPRKQAKCTREVVLSCGTFNSPQLLMLSGIGPKEEIEKVMPNGSDFKLRVDLPGVGKNLQDRYEVGVVHRTEHPLDLVKDCKFAESMGDSCYSDWKTNAKGAYTSNGGVISILKKSVPTLTNPDLFIFLLPTDFRGYQVDYSKTTTTAKHNTTWAILKAHTHNRGGYVKLKSSNPFERPEINFRYYEDGTDRNDRTFGGGENSNIEDLEAMVTGIEFVRKLVKDAESVYDKLELGIDDIAEVITKREVARFQEVCPGEHYSTRAKLKEWTRRNSWGHHACGTCKMGPSTDKDAVVDSKFKVHGVKNLRVVDASIFPRIPGYFIVSSIYAISERATDEILADQGMSRRIKTT